jgi:hypothetical protein
MKYINSKSMSLLTALVCLFTYARSFADEPQKLTTINATVFLCDSVTDENSSSSYIAAVSADLNDQGQIIKGETSLKDSKEIKDLSIFPRVWGAGKRITLAVKFKLNDETKTIKGGYSSDFNSSTVTSIGDCMSQSDVGHYYIRYGNLSKK